MEQVGIVINCRSDTDFLEEFSIAADMGLTSCQISVWDPSLYTNETALAIRGAVRETGLRVSVLRAGYTGPCEWNLTAGPDTVGLVPEAYRARRIEQLLSASVFCDKIGVADLAAYAGFLPENPTAPADGPVSACLRYLCGALRSRGQNLLLETGLETPVALLRVLRGLEADNVFVNFDTAAYLQYGKGNPADAVRILGDYVRGVRIRDGFYSRDGLTAGAQTRIGEGMVDFPLVLGLLKDSGYTGPYTIDRDVSGERGRREAAEALRFLSEVLEDL
ncbi:MAG: sugar phosphate isomerase/epimerase [Clostridia bacterium]|nr:sugar phosphate isomerase/epimerase [Clostridia bacterium]